MDLPADHPSRRRLPPLLRNCWMRLNYTFMRRLADLNLTPDQYVALRWLVEATDAGLSGLSQVEIVERMTSDPNTIAAMMKRMEKAGLVARIPDPADKRRHIVSTTSSGQDTFAKALVRAKELESQALRGLNAKEKQSFLTNLTAIATACMKARANDGNLNQPKETGPNL